MNFVIACGGTGGHLFPGLAVAEALKARGHEVMLLVSEKEIDAVALKAHPEFKAEKLPSVGLPSVLSPAFIRFMRRTWESLNRCGHIYRKFRPDGVLGMGGFTSTAPLLAGRLRRIPTFIHESNAIPGRANKLAARFATRVLLGFEPCANYLPGVEYTVTGTPVRKSLGEPIPKEQALEAFGLKPGKPVLLVTGGSQGAAGINQLMFKAAPLFRDKEIQIIHFTGDRDDLLAAANYQREGIPHYVAPFYHKMEEAYSAADLIISRAGASSLSELSRFALPAILIPYPFATDNHQQLNAEIFTAANAAEMLIEAKTSADGLAAMVSNLLVDENRRQAMSEACGRLLPNDAAGKVADTIEQTCRRI